MMQEPICLAVTRVMSLFQDAHIDDFMAKLYSHDDIEQRKERVRVILFYILEEMMKSRTRIHVHKDIQSIVKHMCTLLDLDDSLWFELETDLKDAPGFSKLELFERYDFPSLRSRSFGLSFGVQPPQEIPSVKYYGASAPRVFMPDDHVMLLNYFDNIGTDDKNSFVIVPSRSRR